MISYLWGKTTGMTADFSVETIEARRIFSKCKKKRIVNPEFYIRQKYPSRMRVNQGILR